MTNFSPKRLTGQRRGRFSEHLLFSVSVRTIDGRSELVVREDCNGTLFESHSWPFAVHSFDPLQFGEITATLDQLTLYQLLRACAPQLHFDLDELGAQ
jgi:hypothetical protein